MSSAELSVFIRAIGVHTPERKLTNAELSSMVDTSDEWIKTRSGIAERRIAAPGENPSDMGAKAAAKALGRAGLTPADVDLLIVATMTPDVPFPSTACLLQAKLGLRRDIPCFDISAACSGFVYALQVARDMMRSGVYRRVLVVGAEKLSSVVDWSDRTTCVLFGDGAGAVLLETTAEKDVGLLGNLLGADGNNAELLHCVGGGSAAPATTDSLRDGKHFLRMNGKEVFRHAVRVMAESCERVLAQCGVKSEQVAWFIPHQANSRILEAVASQLNVGMDRFPSNLERYGNTSAASIPLALEEAWKDGKIKHGDLVLIVAFGAGLTWGATLLRWHEPTR
ncbi:MAG: ketoacyl-ACP synthase III [Opitutales bacterium]|jgi:3-oxoacyl-[acyl-carrier-protein] synthase-3|nr:ketoacyl-ACP synthase III [Opitutales bacterium]